MKRVLMVTTFYPPYSFGGDAIDVQLWAGALTRRGCAVTVVHNEDAYMALASQPQRDFQPEPGVEVIPLRSRWGRLGLLLSHQTGQPGVYAPQLQRLCAERHFDTIVFVNTSLIGGPGVFALGGDAVRVVIASEHWLICPTHVLWRYDAVPCEERRCLRCTLHHHRPPQLWRHTGLLEQAGRHIDAFIARSEFSRRKHEEYGFPFSMQVVPNFVPPPGPAGSRPHDRPYVFFAGRVEESKGLGDVLPFFLDNPGVDLVIAGTGTAEAALRQQTAGATHVRWLGFVPRHELGAWYAHAVASLVPSTTFETFGIVVIEALSHGTPVIARRRGPLPELVEKGGGLLFDTPDEMARAVRSLIESPARRQELADSARRAFDAHWREDAVVPRFIDIVERVRAARAAAAQAGIAG